MIVIKLGGAALVHSLHSDELFQVLAKTQESTLIVHGGGPDISKISEALKLEATFVEGQRVTTPETLEVVEMVLSGKINPALVRGLLKAGRPAFGLSGVSCGLFSCVREEDTRLGQVGRVEHVQKEILDLLLEKNFLPVISPIGIFNEKTDHPGEACNVNADLAAAAVARAVKASRILFLTDIDGICDAHGKLQQHLNPPELEQMVAQGVVKGGMKVKARAALEALREYPDCRVEIMNGMSADALKMALIEGKSPGTLIQ